MGNKGYFISSHRLSPFLALCRLNRKSAIIAVIVEQAVAKRVVPIISVGFAELAFKRKAIIVAGTKVNEDVFNARNVHMAWLAVFGCGLSSCSSLIAFRPKGVAALPRPSKFALKFIRIEPIAG